MEMEKVPIFLLIWTVLILITLFGNFSRDTADSANEPSYHLLEVIGLLIALLYTIWPATEPILFEEDRSKTFADKSIGTDSEEEDLEDDYLGSSLHVEGESETQFHSTLEWDIPHKSSSLNDSESTIGNSDVEPTTLKLQNPTAAVALGIYCSYFCVQIRDDARTRNQNRI